MKKFNEWLEAEHPEILEESWFKNLAMGGALVGAGLGIGHEASGKDNDKISSSSVTSPEAAEFFPSKNFKKSNKNSINTPTNNSMKTSTNGSDYSNNSSNYHWNSEIGRYKAIDNGDGTYTFQTKNGNYKRVKNVLGQNKFIKIK